MKPETSHKRIHSQVAIIVLQFNNSRDTIRCLESVKELNWQNFEVVIVDNASETQHLNNIRLFVESQEKMGERRFKLIMNKENLGYAGGNNIGIKYALESGADYVLILNPDTIVKRDLLKKLIKVTEERRGTGIVGPAAKEGRKTVYCGEIKWLKSELRHSSLKPKTSNLKPNFYVPGAAMFVRRKVFEKIGFFDEKYFLYFEDADFCIRARRAGFKLAITPNASIQHNPSSSTSKLGPALLLRYHYRNAHLFNIKNGPIWAKILLPFLSLWAIIKQAVKLLFNINPQISRAILNGVVDFYKKRFGKIYV